MTKYTSTLTENNQPSAGKEYLSYSLDAFLESHASAILYFNNGTLASCRLPVSWGSLLYAQANSDSFNVSVGIIQGYQRWTIDSDVQEMVNLLNRVSSLRNTTETSDNITLRISAFTYYTEYRFNYT